MTSSVQSQMERQAQGAAEAWLRAVIAFQRTDALLANSRALVDESRKLLATLERADLPRMPRQSSQSGGLAGSRTRPTFTGNHNVLSIHVFQDGMRFGWTLYSPAHKMLGQGTAETELKARVDALHAGMTYISRSKTGSATSDVSLH